ncbi:serine hydrolase domain-containing protein [Chitinophaga niabensis]|uniref:CubicO group peptidase, beta-lactamase class C family n=1 Tax=Chitinophaga niabensis TaxID=536979 RepID=A0A1N6F9H9_9BACT|nr:serine hydrolase domain-containing protein [Chitinophaga niabensis]SIN91900.1 CubicO group peptidase, beta-lactamase class C family [Chitinophaga niabensis]
MKKILFLLVFSNAAFAQLPQKAKLDQYFDRLAEKNKAMGNLSIAKDGKVLYTRSIGYSQLNVKPLTAESRFRIGSITKMFTTAMIFQLIEEGKLKPEDTLAKFFPQIPNAGKITIAQMLGHRSGIPNVRRAQVHGKNVNTLPMKKDEMLTLIVNGKPDFEPGTKHGYSNSAYLVLGLILEKVTGRSYAKNLEKRVTGKIGLKDTYMATGNIDVNKKEALTYMYFDSAWKQMPETHPGILFSAGAIVSTPNDLNKFIQALFDGKIVSKESLDQMKTMIEGEGMGMEPFTFAGKTFYGHTGGADNYGAWLAYQPEEKLAVAYTTNAKVVPVRDIVSGVIDIYYDKPFQIPGFEAIAVSAEVLDQYTGIYTTPDAPVKFTISRQGTILFIQPPGESKAAPLEAIAQDKFQIQGAIVVEFDAAKKQMIIKRAGGQRVFTKEK